MSKDASNTTCFLCPEAAALECPSCKRTRACGERHLNAHRHQDVEGAAYTCLPFHTSYKDGVGRCLVATRDIHPLELILRDSPIVLGPDLDCTGQNEGLPEKSSVVCFACFLPLDEVGSACKKCNLPLCSESCIELEMHSLNECQLLTSRDTALKSVDEIANLQQCLLPLRMMLLKEKDPESYRNVMLLMDHNDVRIKDKESWQRLQVQVVDFLRFNLQLGDMFTESELHRCLGIIRTNCIGTSDRSLGVNIEGVRSRSLLPTMALLSHSCISNARCVQLERHGIEVRAQSEILAGDEITIQYTSLLSGSRARRALLKRNWCFECTCQRCADPTERGTYQNAIKCQSCCATDQSSSQPGNFLLPLEPLVIGADFICSKCKAKMSSEEVQDLEEKFALQLSCDNSRGCEFIQGQEKLLEEGLRYFHPNHCLIMKIKSFLISHYGNIPGYLYHELSEEQLRQKEALCLEFIAVYDRIDPGATDWRGSTLFELAMTRTTLAQRGFDQGHFSVEVFKSELDKAIGLLEEVVPLMSVERMGTYSYDIGRRARKNLTDLKDVRRFAQFLA